MRYRAQDVHVISVADERPGHVQRVRLVLVEEKDPGGTHGSYGLNRKVTPTLPRQKSKLPGAMSTLVPCVHDGFWF